MYNMETEGLGDGGGTSPLAGSSGGLSGGMRLSPLSGNISNMTSEGIINNTLDVNTSENTTTDTKTLHT